MNEQYINVATSANVIQSILSTVLLLDRDSVEIPEDQEEIVQDIQATIARKLGGV